MSRKKKIKKQFILPDHYYNNIMVAKFINQVMKQGKKAIARKIIYSAFNILKEKTKKEPLEIFDQAIKNVSPLLELKPRRVGGATYQVPKEMKESRQISLAMHWLIQAAKEKKGKPMKEKLAEELLNASNNTGNAVKKKENVHRMAEANSVFAHFN